ncbi:cytochrome d ubiquinol oxidase subunit II [Texcoconibacillus texcoconensis]|uniref:Cytochrome d ubiquinol oxidase subunit II n=1 Tax=Texcoconibacillus texcoconensis TaxID=1095777 RepID=A0A840QPM4_9BACI|nr:cytochrome d ubiquinol oxidase subunit II [Texcoconibacillus texcoconensis]MBB5173273.1 cytochrome d ubiquinol oxidase subunit II [Texcoconibacillus texcoconensis]
MSYELIGITVLWTFLYGYLIVASIDFGAGFFSYYSRITNNKHKVHHMIQRYLSPVWEVTNVFLVFFFVGIVGFFPDTAYYYGSALLIPGSISIILIALRGSYYAFATYGSKDSHLYTFLYGGTGLLIPASLTTVLTVAVGGYVSVEENHVQLLYGELFTSIYSWSVVALAIVSVLFISGSFMTFYAHKAGDQPALDLLRKYALAWSFPTIIACVIAFFGMNQRNPSHFQNMTDLSWLYGLSVVFFLAAVILIWKRKRYGLAFIFVMLQFATAFFAYGAAHLPYLLYPHLTIYDGVTNDAMAISLIIVFIAGLLLLIPSLYLLMRLFLFDTNYVKGHEADKKA